MRFGWILAALLPVTLSGCQVPGSSNAAVELAPLTLGEVHREPGQPAIECRAGEKSSVYCRATTRRIKVAKLAAPEVAPFLAQIYLHPEFTTEKDLIEQGAKNRPRWSVRHICGGALIAPNWVATAAHCLPEPRLDTKYGVRLGLNNISAEEGVLFNVKEVVRRNPNGRTRDSDLALVRIGSSVDNANAVSAAALTRSAAPKPSVVFVDPKFRDNEMLVVDDTRTLHLIDTRSGRINHSDRFRGSLQSLARGRRLAFASDTGITVFDLVDRQSVQAVDAPGINQAIFLSDESRVITKQYGSNLLSVYNLITGQKLFDLGSSDRHEFTELPKTNRLLVEYFPNSRVALFDLETGAPLSLNLPERSQFQGAFDDDIHIAFYNFEDAFTRVFDSTNGTLKSIRNVGQPIRIDGDPGSASYIVTERNGLIVLSEAETLTEVASFPISGDFHSATWLNGGNRLLVHDDGASVFDLETLEIFDSIVMPIGTELTAVNVGSDTDTIIAKTLPPQTYIPAGENANRFAEAVYAWVPRSHLIGLNPLTLGEQHTRSLVELSEDFLVTSEYLFGTDYREGRTYVWERQVCQALPAGSDCTPKRVLDYDLAVKKIQLYGDLDILTVITHNGTVQVWQPSSGLEKFRVFHGGEVVGVSLNRQTNELITYGLNGLLRIWDGETGDEKRRLSFEDTNPNEPPDIITPQSNRRAINAPRAVYIDVDQSGAQLADGAPVRVYGWGKYDEAAATRRSQNLREAGLRVLSNGTCNSQRYWDGHKDIHDRVFCAHDQSRKTCVGDSGGPVVKGSTLGELTLVGIASWGSRKCDDNDDKPGVYTRIASHADWIEEVIKNQPPPE